jgi:predicted DNA-binding transcriptional regulator YafY
MRADRLLSIMLLLRVDRRLTARDLASRLEVSERTILRDLEALGAAGVPVMAERGAGGGWSLASAFRTDLTGLSGEELQSLLLTKSSSRLAADLGLNQAAASAVIKLFASMNAASRRDMEFARMRLHIDGAGWYQSSEAFPLLRMVQEAVWQERKLQIVYRKADSSESDRLVDPLGLVAKGSVWYLVAARGSELRSYRVSRIVSAAVMDAACERPADFDLAKYWESSVAEFIATAPRYEVTLRAAPDFAARLHRSKFVRIQFEAEPDNDGWKQMQVRFEDEREACDYMIRAGSEAVVLEPAELRERLRRTSLEIVAVYS